MNAVTTRTITKIKANPLLVKNCTEIAEIVRLINQKCLDRDSIEQIYNCLESHNNPTQKNNKEWERQVIRDILHNEKFDGNLMR